MHHHEPIPLLTIAGTRPEALKLAPLIRQLRDTGAPLTTLTCFSGQHREILESVLGCLDVKPDVDLRHEAVNHNLTESLAWLLERIDKAVDKTMPKGIIVQGDTNTALAGAMVGFHRHLPVFHVEAGLRTDDPMLPFPEEMNRRLISRLAALHFAPTERARQNLLRENVAEAAVEVTGNTGIDSLRIYAGQQNEEAEKILATCRPGTRRILVTMHRRENKGLVEEATGAIRHIVMANPDVEVIWLLHLNGIRNTVLRDLSSHQSVHLLEPQPYRTFVHLMKSVDFVLTDSGGVQEEAPTLGKPVLVMRNDTERPEAVEAGSALVVGCEMGSIVKAARRLLDDKAHFAFMSRPRSPFGDGHASERIVAALRRYFHVAEHPSEKRHVG